MKLNVAIVGLGVVGGSFAKAFQKYMSEDIYVMGLDKDPKTLTAALEDGAISEGELSNDTILQRADLVIIALYPQAMINYLLENKESFKKGAVVTDVVGVKQKIIDAVSPSLPEQVDFIFGHPMAGRESSGFAYADADIFQGANYVLTPLPKNKAENIQLIKTISNRLGFKRITLVDAEEHDEMIAFTSQLCHVIAVSLINSDQHPNETVHFIGDSYRDLTRIAKINGPLWSELFLENKDALLTMMSHFEEQWGSMKDALVNSDKKQLEELFASSTQRRQLLEQEDLKNRL